MKTNNSSHLHRTPLYRRPIVVLFSIIIVAVVAVITILIFHLLRPKVADTSPTDAGSSILDTPSDLVSSEDNPTDDYESKVTQYEGEDVNDLDVLTGSITFTDYDPNTQQLSVGTVIAQYLSDPGNCTLRLLQDQRELYRTTVPAFADITASACETFTIPTTNLPSGAYQIEITFSGDNKNGIITDGVQI